MHSSEKTRELRRAESFEGQFECAGLAGIRIRRHGRTIRADGKKQLRHGLKFMNAAAQKRSTCFEKNETAALHDGLDQVRNSGMLQRLAPADPKDGRGTGKKAVNSFMRNGMSRARVQDFCRVDKINQRYLTGPPEESGETSFCQFCKEQRRKAHAA